MYCDMESDRFVIFCSINTVTAATVWQYSHLSSYALALVLHTLQDISQTYVLPQQIANTCIFIGWFDIILWT